jgi:hypothetical protein
VHTEVSLLRENHKVAFQLRISGGHVLSKCPKERHSPPPWNIKFQYESGKNMADWKNPLRSINQTWDRCPNQSFMIYINQNLPWPTVLKLNSVNSLALIEFIAKRQRIILIITSSGSSVVVKSTTYKSESCTFKSEHTRTIYRKVRWQTDLTSIVIFNFQFKSIQYSAKQYEVLHYSPCIPIK